MRRLFLAILLCSVACLAGDKSRVNPKLAGVSSIYIDGNNQAAEKAREVVEHGKTCFSLATKPEDADATLAIDTNSQSQGGSFGAFGARNWIASGTLKTKAGDLVWSHSERFDDAPFRSGGKVAGELLVRRLAAEAGCKDRKKP